jgi:hypothetical protein
MERKTKRDRNPGRDPVVPSEDKGREAQDRAKPGGRTGGARSPVDAMHVDAPKHRDNEHGHRAERSTREE